MKRRIPSRNDGWRPGASLGRPWPVRAAALWTGLLAAGILCGISFRALAVETNLYHYNVTNILFEPTNLPAGTPVVSDILSEEESLERLVGPFNVRTNAFWANEYEMVAWGYPDAPVAWATVLGYYSPYNWAWWPFCMHTNHFFDNVGWVKGVRSVPGPGGSTYGASLWLLQNTLRFMSSTTDVYVSSAGVTSSVLRVQVGSLGDYNPSNSVTEIGPTLDTNYPGWNTFTTRICRADTRAFYKLPLKATIPCNDGDVDGDSIPDFADGFNWDGVAGDDDATANAFFQPWKLTLPAYVDVSNTLIKVEYSNSPPAGVIRTGSPGSYVYAPATGALRVWTRPARVPRNKLPVLQNGHFVAATGYKAADLGFTPDKKSINLFIEGIRPSTNQSIRVTYSHKGAPWLTLDKVNPCVPEVDLDVDTDRDGVVENNDQDEANEDCWAKDRGAIYNVNFDRDGSRTAGGEPRPDAIHFSDWGIAEDEDYVIENSDDVEDIAPLVIRKIQPEIPEGWKVYLKVAEQEDIQRIHVYKKIEADAGNTAIWGTMSGAAPATELDITCWVDPDDASFQGDMATGDATFGIEGLCFRNQGNDVDPLLEFDGYIDFTLELRNGSTVMGSDRARLKVAPWMMLTRDQASEEVWAIDGVSGSDEFLHSATTGYKGLDDSGQLNTALLPDVGTQWLQDHVEIGFTQRPGGPKTYIVFRLPYARGALDPNPVWPLKKLLKKDVGTFQIGLYLGALYATGDYGGNLEILPPDGTCPLGRIELGDSVNPSATLQQFLASQEVQLPKCDVPVGWLEVAHIDEITSFLPGGVVAIADPTMAWNLLEAIPAVDRGKSVFFATGASPVAGVATANSTANMRIETGIDHTGQSWAYIRIYDGVEGGTVGEIDTLGNGYITLTKVWKTSSKIIRGVSPSHDIMYWAEEEEAPLAFNWQPQAGDKYVLCEGTRFWSTMTPAIVTADEILTDSDFEMLNTTIIQALINQAKSRLLAASSALTFKEVPNLFFGKLINGAIVPHSSVAFNPGPTNLQPLNGKLYAPRQFSPLNSAGVDIFEASVRAALGGTVEYVDCWDLYHRFSGEVHCGSNVKRSALGINWWENQP